MQSRITGKSSGFLLSSPSVSSCKQAAGDLNRTEGTMVMHCIGRLGNQQDTMPKGGAGPTES